MVAARRPAAIPAQPGHAHALPAVPPFARAQLQPQCRLQLEVNPQAGLPRQNGVTLTSFVTVLRGLNPHESLWIAVNKHPRPSAR